MTTVTRAAGQTRKLTRPFDSFEVSICNSTQLQTFPYPSTSKPLLSSSFSGRSRSLKLYGSLQQRDGQTDRQTDRPTNKQKTQHFDSLRGVRSLSPTALGMLIDDREHVLAPPKRVGFDAWFGR